MEKKKKKDIINRSEIRVVIQTRSKTNLLQLYSVNGVNATEHSHVQIQTTMYSKVIQSCEWVVRRCKLASFATILMEEALHFKKKTRKGT